MKQWLMMQRFVALHTMYGKMPGKQATYRTPKGAGKQLDCVLINRKNLRYRRNAEAKDDKKAEH